MVGLSELVQLIGEHGSVNKCESKWFLYGSFSQLSRGIKKTFSIFFTFWLRDELLRHCSKKFLFLLTLHQNIGHFFFILSHL